MALRVGIEPWNQEGHISTGPDHGSAIFGSLKLALRLILRLRGFWAQTEHSQVSHTGAPDGGSCSPRCAASAQKWQKNHKFLAAKPIFQLPHWNLPLYFALSFFSCASLFCLDKEGMLTSLSVLLTLVKLSECWSWPGADKWHRSCVWHLQPVSASRCEGGFFNSQRCTAHYRTALRPNTQRGLVENLISIYLWPF